jgi:hypothetical protein
MEFVSSFISGQLLQGGSYRIGAYKNSIRLLLNLPPRPLDGGHPALEEKGGEISQYLLVEKI